LCYVSTPSFYLPCCFSCYRAHRDLHSFPTRRSSDLTGTAVANIKEAWRWPGATCGRRAREKMGGLPVKTHLLAAAAAVALTVSRSEEHTSELQSRENLVCRLLLEKKKKKNKKHNTTY